MPKVLISDALSPAAVQIFKDRGIEVDFQPALGKDKEKLAELIGDFDGLAIRSATKVTAKILENAKNLKVIGRAGIGVDNVDIPAATARGIIVMNTPFGNSITTAEHAITLMLSLARQIPEADASTRAGKWEKSRFMGVELFAKTLGLIGCGNIGSIVADRAIGLKMHVLVYDPYLTDKRALDLGVAQGQARRTAGAEPTSSPCTSRSPRPPATSSPARGFGADKKPGVRIVNCARGGLIDEAALLEALQSGHVAGAALEHVRPKNRPPQSPLFALGNVVCTPHLGAATSEAQENVALQVAEQMSDYLLTGAVTNAINMPSALRRGGAAPRPLHGAVPPVLGSFAGQLTMAQGSQLTAVSVEYQGAVAHLSHRPLTAAALAGLLEPDDGRHPEHGQRPHFGAPRSAASSEVAETVYDRPSEYQTLVRIAVTTERQERAVAGTLFAGSKPRLVNVKGIPIEANFARHHALRDQPGQAGLHRPLRRHPLGRGGDQHRHLPPRPRRAPGGDASTLVEIDGKVSPELLAKVQEIPNVQQVKPLLF